jgi:hypothetical protein
LDPGSQTSWRKCLVPLKETDISGPERHARDAIEQHGRRGLGRVSHALALRDKRGHLHANATPRYVRARIRNIVPVVLDGFEFPVAENRLDRLSALQHYNGLRVHTDYFPEGMSKMREKFLNVPLAAVIHPLSPSATLAAQEQASAAVNAPPITELELKESEQPRYVFVVKFKYQDGAERIEGTRAEEPQGPTTLIVYDGSAIVVRLSDVDRWSRQQIPKQPLF